MSPVGGSSASIALGDDPTFDFSFSSTDGSGISATGSVDANPLTDGNYLANGGSITIDGGVDAGTYLLGLAVLA